MLDQEVCDTLGEARVAVELWRGQSNQVRPRSALGYCPPVPEAAEAVPLGVGM